GHAAAIPVIGGLCGGELKLFDFRVKAKAAGGAEPGTGESAIAEGDTELLELACGLGGGRFGPAMAKTGARSRLRVGLRDLQKGVAATHRERPRVVVDQQRAGIHAAQLKIV